MSTTNWRRLLLALCAIALVEVAASTWMEATQMGFPGIVYTVTSPNNVTGTGTATPFVNRVTVAEGGPAYRAGLRTGDLVDLRPLSPGDRYRWSMGYWRAGERIDIPVIRGTATVHITVVAEFGEFTWDVWLASAGFVWMIAFAVMITLRGAHSAEARMLALVLLLYNIGINLMAFNWSTPWPGLDALAAGAGAFVNYSGYALLATYALLFAVPPSPLRRTLAYLSYAACGIGALYGAVALAGIWTGTLDPDQAWYSGALPQIVTGVLPCTLPLACAIVSVLQAKGREQARLAWTTISLGFLYFITAILNTFVAFDLNLSTHFLITVFDFVILVAPVGLTYSLFNRRLLDVAFVINRAAVYSIVSLLLVGTFMLIEWLLGDWLHDASHTTNLVVGGGLTLALGLSMRAVHSRVDGIVDAIFFRKRHEDEQAIRSFSHEVGFITESAVVRARTVETLEEHAEAAFVTMFLDDGNGHYDGIDENDPALVALRAGRKVVDLHAIDTVLQGEFAYPMVARRRLVGALVIGPTRSGVSYAPDESEAIAYLAHSVGDALDVLAEKREDLRDVLMEAIRALPEAIVRRMRETP